MVHLREGIASVIFRNAASGLEVFFFFNVAWPKTSVRVADIGESLDCLDNAGTFYAGPDARSGWHDERDIDRVKFFLPLGSRFPGRKFVLFDVAGRGAGSGQDTVAFNERLQTRWDTWPTGSEVFFVLPYALGRA